MALKEPGDCANAARSFGLDAKRAIKEARNVARVVDNWKQHFKAEGVSSREIELHAELIDRPFLRAAQSARAPKAIPASIAGRKRAFVMRHGGSDESGAKLAQQLEIVQ